MSFSVSTQGQVSVGLSVTDAAHAVALLTSAQQWGSAWLNRPTYQPLHDLILTMNNNMDIFPKRYLGYDVYNRMAGEVITLEGEILSVAMGELTSKEGEKITPLGTIINCLSVGMTRTALSSVVAAIIMLCSQGHIEPGMESTMRALEGRVMKYANSVLSRDIMCNMREIVKERILDLLGKRLPEQLQHLRNTVFHPPRLRDEERDYAAFFYRVISNRADNEEVYTRSVKLLGMALLLYHYGWHISATVEDAQGKEFDVVTAVGSLSVRFSINTGIVHKEREYIENHELFKTPKAHSTQDFYPTATCTAANVAQVASLTMSDSSSHSREFLRHFEQLQRFYRNYVDMEIYFKKGRIALTSHKRSVIPSDPLNLRSCQDLLQSFFGGMPQSVLELMARSLCDLYQNCNWDHLRDEIQTQKNPEASLVTLASSFTGESSKLWSIAGTVCGTIDLFARILCNIKDKCVVRTPAGESLTKCISASGGTIRDLLDTGLEPGEAVRFCAIWLAGVDPHDLKMTPGVVPGSHIGYWNGEQGILLTTIFERSLYCDLPLEKARPLTLHNIPIIGMPSDDGGWIKPANTEGPIIRRRPVNTNSVSPDCAVIIEYRPHFEGDSNSVVAAIYLNAVYFGSCDLRSTLPSDFYEVSTCDHIDGDKLGQDIMSVDIATLDPWQVAVPRDELMVALINPQLSPVFRLFSTLLYRSLKPIVRNGCLQCAINQAQETRTCIIIGRLLK